jgi:hypothetical protein
MEWLRWACLARRREERLALGSDVDILVRFDRSPRLFGFIELENYLTDLLGVSVDLVQADALKPGIRRRIMDEVMAV